eukprot:8688397-Alexandrium_andersonii.AAC.1
MKCPGKAFKNDSQRKSWLESQGIKVDESDNGQYCVLIKVDAPGVENVRIGRRQSVEKEKRESHESGAAASAAHQKN